MTSNKKEEDEEEEEEDTTIPTSLYETFRWMVNEHRFRDLDALMIQQGIRSYEQIVDRMTHTTLLHDVCLAADLLAFTRIISKYSNLEMLDINIRTPLHCAAIGGNLHIVDYLIKRGCNTTCRDSLGFSIYNEVCMRGYAKIRDYLMERRDPCFLEELSDSEKDPVSCMIKNREFKVAYALAKNGNIINFVVAKHAIFLYHVICDGVEGMMLFRILILLLKNETVGLLAEYMATKSFSFNPKIEAGMKQFIAHPYLFMRNSRIMFSQFLKQRGAYY